MLKEFIQDAAAAFDQTGHPVAQDVASLLESLEVSADWQAPQKQPALAVLPAALAATDCHPAAARFADIAEHLTWNGTSHLSPNSVADIYCFVMIAGPGAMIEDTRFRFGVYLQIPGVHYPSHRHEAVELYLPLSGTAEWQKDRAAFRPVTPGTLIHHKSYQPHATRTLEAPLLALWAWTGNLSLGTYSIDAD